MQSQGKLYVVGLGPGSQDMLTIRALMAIEESEYIVGYEKYVKRISSLIAGKKVVTTGMHKEVERVKIAVELAKNSVVSLVSGGDPSIYGMLPLVVEYLLENGIEINVEVVPGITALNAASALLGSPISGDHAVVSLSDLLVPWNEVEKKLLYALKGDFVVAIYNPSSRRRRGNLKKALDIIMAERGDVFVGVVKNAFREGQEVYIKRISEISVDEIDMNTILIVSSPKTVVKNGKMLTPRGYSSKYDVGEAKPKKMGARTEKAITIATRSSEILKKIHPGDRIEDEIIRRCIATTGDPSIKDYIRFNGDVRVGVEALRQKCRIIVDVNMLKAGLRRVAISAIDFAEDSDETRVVSGLRKLENLIEGSFIGIGNAPSAAIELCRIASEKKPKFIVATPVGFVNASESKEMIRNLDVPSITTAGTRGGSTICAAIINCMIEYAERSD